MKDIITQAYSGQSFREMADGIVNLLADHLDASGGRKTVDWKNPQEQLRFWEDDFKSKQLATPLALFRTVIENSVDIHNPRYLGHQVAPTLPVSILSAAIVAYLNQSLPVYEMGMVGNALERILTQDLAKKFGFSHEAAGVITSGGTVANLTALLSARSLFDEADYQKLVVFVSAEAHYSIERAAKIIGLSAKNIIKVPLNEEYQIQTETLDKLYENVITEGKKVLCLVGCACSTALGIYDDLERLGDWASTNGIWFHVDGAHGAAVIYSPTYKFLIKGVEKADSVILDYHKLLMAPSLSTALIYKKGVYAKRTFAQKADYLFSGNDEDDWYNSGKRTFECTKPMNILNTYTILRVHGETIYQQNVDRLYGLAKQFSKMIGDSPDFELAIEPQSNIVCFRIRSDQDIDSINRQISQELLHKGTFFIVNTLIKGEFWLRVSIQNPLTTIDDLEALLHDLKSSVVNPRTRSVL